MAMDNTQDRLNEISDLNRDDGVRHGLDGNSNNDAEKGAALGGLGGAAVGAAAGSIAGPVGTLIGAVAGGLVGAGASGAAVAAVDAVDNDNTVSGIGSGVTRDSDGARVGTSEVRMSSDAPVTPGLGEPGHGHNIVTGGQAHTEAGDSGLAGGAVAGGLIGAAVGGPVGAVVGGTLGSLAGGVAGDAAEATDETDVVADQNYRSGVPTDVNTNVAVSSSDPIMAGDSSVMGGDGHNVVTGGPATSEAGDTGLAGGAVVGGVVGAAVGGPVGAVIGGTLGSLAGGVAGDAAEAADEEDLARSNNYAGGAYQADAAMNPAISSMSSRPTDDTVTPSEQTDYRSVDEGMTSIGVTSQNSDTTVLGVTDTPGVRTGSEVYAPGVQTGGRTTQGPDTRGLMEKTADAITGDNVDDKTGGRVLNDPDNR